MTSPRRTRINKKRKKKLMKTGGLFLFLLLVTVFIMIWTVTAIEQVLQSDHIRLLGVHCHIGSQIFDTAGFVLAAEKIFTKLNEWRESFGFVSEVLNLGGGFGIRYTEEDEPLHPAVYVEKIIEAVKENAALHAFDIPEIWIEPGRSLVGDAGTTLYTIGSQKEVPGTRKYAAVDGGMSDNIRPALYQAKYEAVSANRIGEHHDKTVSIAGKCCESGDMLIWDILKSNEASLIGYDSIQTQIIIKGFENYLMMGADNKKWDNE